MFFLEFLNLKKYIYKTMSLVWPLPISFTSDFNFCCRHCCHWRNLFLCSSLKSQKCVEHRMYFKIQVYIVSKTCLLFSGFRISGFKLNYEFIYKNCTWARNIQLKINFYQWYLNYFIERKNLKFQRSERGF